MNKTKPCWRWLFLVLFPLAIIGCTAETDEMKELAMEKQDMMYYGVNELADRMTQSEAQAEGWKFDSQETGSLVETGNTEAPFITTVSTCFRSPQDEKYRGL